MKAMGVFISWSGEISPSHELAKALDKWIPNVIQHVDCYLSSRDNVAGTPWFENMIKELGGNNVGLVCLSSENLESRWIHFEAGAIAIKTGKTRLCPLVIDVKKSDVPPPLFMFQIKTLNKEDMLSVIEMINDDCGENRLTEEKLKPAFEIWWTQLEPVLENIKAMKRSTHTLGFAAITSDVEYPVGTNIGAISWISRFRDLRILIINEAGSDYSDIDLILRPDVPVASIGQVSNLPDVTFSPVADNTFSQELFVSATRKRVVNLLVLIASDGGYRVVRKSLPHKSKLEITFATAEIIDFPKPGVSQTPRPDFGIFDRDYALKVEMKDNETKAITNNWYGRGSDANGRIEEVYKTATPLAKTVQISGRYKVDQEYLPISTKIDAKDVIGDILRERFGLTN